MFDIILTFKNQKWPKISKTDFVDFDTFNYFKSYLFKIIKLNFTEASSEVFFEPPWVNKFKQLFVLFNHFNISLSSKI